MESDPLQQSPELSQRLPRRPGGSGCAFIILAHRQPAQVMRLIRRLSPAPILVHVDAGAAADVYDELRRNATRYKSFSLLPRVRSSWGSWGIAAAALCGLRHAAALEVTHVAILSGQDYPLVSAEQMRRFSELHADLSFVASWSIPTPLWGRDGGIGRIRYWHQSIRGRRFYLPIPRSFPSGITPFGGSLYCLLTRAAVTAVLDFVDCRPDVVQFYRHAWIPDEMFIPTSLMNSPLSEYVVDENLWYMDWSGTDPGHPKVLVTEDARALVKAAGNESGAGGRARAKLFARKFDADVDRRIFDILDEEACVRLAAEE